MKTVVLNLPTFGFAVATRAAIGFGIGLLVADRFTSARRKAVGAALVAAGAVTTIPIARSILRNARNVSGVCRDDRLIGSSRYPRKGDEYI
jgi:hypothetical protein